MTLQHGDEAIERQRVWRLGSGSVRLLIIDNYDSFTFNLVQLFSVFDTRIEVIRNDRLGVQEALDWPADAYVLSPGPGRPEQAGICVDLLRAAPDVPLLGVCLGHQALGLAFGGQVLSAPTLMHGKTSLIHHEGHAMFDGLPQPFAATRYHSLCVDQGTLPGDLEPLAWSGDDATLMAMAHRVLPYWGVQFHPESVLTEVGPRLLSNFVDLAKDRAAARRAS